MKLPQIQSQFVVINGSMDLTTPPITKANSEAIMALNVQPNYGGGFSRIEGYECLDGKTTPSKWVYSHLRVDKDLPEISAKTSFNLNEHLCFVIETAGDKLTFASEGEIDIAIGTTFSIDDNQFSTITNTHLDNTDSENYQRLMSAAFDIGTENVQPVRGEGDILGVVELGDQIIAFRAATDKRGKYYQRVVYSVEETGWKTAKVNIFCSLQDIKKPELLAVGKRVRCVYQQQDVYFDIKHATLAEDNSFAILILDYLGGSLREPHLLMWLPMMPDEGDEQIARVETSALVRSHSTKPWQFIYHNFYGSPETRYAYGTDGEAVYEIRPNADLIQIYTQNSDKNKPRLVCAHKNHLFVAFEGGLLSHSLPGRPHEFSTLLGSETIAVGDEITALSSGAGGVLLIGCKHKTLALYGDTKDNWVLKEISKVGIVKNTLQTNFLPIAISQNGIIRIDQTEQFGDFRLSETDSGQKLGLKVRESHFVFSSSKPQASQIRYYSDKQMHICLMLNPDGSSKATYFIYPEPLKGVWQSDKHTFLAFSDGKVYRQNDEVFSFAGKPIDWLVKMAFNHCGSPFVVKSWKSGELQATTNGTLKLAYRYDLDYCSDYHASTNLTALSVIGVGGRWNEHLWNDFQWNGSDYEAKTLYLQGHSRNIALSFSGTGTYAPQFEITGLLLNYIPRRNYRV